MDELKENLNVSNHALDNLESLLIEYTEEEQSIKKSLSLNEDRISESEKYLKSLYEKEDVDVRIFSPRNIEDKYQKEISESKEQIQKLKETNYELYHHLNQIQDKKEMLENIRNQLQLQMPDSNLSILLELQENDRKRISSDLHDTTVQDLVYIIQKTELCMKYLNQDTNRVNLELASIIQLLRAAIQNIRNIIYDLRPINFDDFGFTEAVQRLADNLMLNSDFKITTDIDQFEKGHENEFLSLYRSISELVKNAIYHSEGTKIHISIKRKDGKIVTHIIDDGKGYDINELYNDNKEHFGLQIVKNRIDLLGGKIQVESNNKGTDVKIIVKDWTCI